LQRIGERVARGIGPHGWAGNALGDRHREAAACAGGASVKELDAIREEESMQARPTLQALLFSALWALAAIAGPAAAQQGDIAAGAKLYVSQCKICHGSVSALDQEQAAPALPGWQLARLAMQHGAEAVRSDAPSILATTSSPAADRGDWLAFAPPFGPHLRNVYGRAAGTVEDFQYSSTFVKTLKGMEWNDAALDVWITDPQAWVPGVYMFYKQRDPDVRRKIIEYLKASR
jgi:cytochrome c2